MANTKHGLPETKGKIKLRGLTTGVQRENAFTEKPTKTGKGRRVLNVGIQTAPESTVYVSIEGMERDDVTFGKRSEVKGQKGEQKKVKWDSRFDKLPEGFNMYGGVRIGLQKDLEDKNIIEHVTEFDAAEKAYSLLEDDKPVFVMGKLEYSSFKNNDGDVRRNKKFLIENIYNAKEIDFEDEKFEETSDFKQRLVFMGINKAEDQKDPHFILEAKVITYSTIEDTEFVIRNASLANTFRSNLKPYQAIDVWGKIFNKVDAEDIQEQKASVWGEEDNFKRVTKNYIRELVIVGADPETLDVETYSEVAISEAIAKLNSQGQVSGGNAWGSNEPEVKDDDLPW